MTPAPERPDPIDISGEDHVDDLPFGGYVPAPERPDPRILTSAEVDAIARRMDVWSDYGPDPSSTIEDLIATIRAAAPAPDAGLDVERLAHAYNNVVVLTGTGKGWTMETWGKVAAEYAALSRQAEKEPRCVFDCDYCATDGPGDYARALSRQAEKENG